MNFYGSRERACFIAYPLMMLPIVRVDDVSAGGNWIWLDLGSLTICARERVSFLIGYLCIHTQTHTRGCATMPNSEMHRLEISNMHWNLYHFTTNCRRQIAFRVFIRHTCARLRTCLLYAGRCSSTVKAAFANRYTQTHEVYILLEHWGEGLGHTDLFAQTSIDGIASQS